MTPSDWSVLVAGISASVAAAAVVWNVVWSLLKSQQETRTRLAEREFAWADDFRRRVSEVSALGNILHTHAMAPLNEEIRKLLERALREIGHIDLMFPDPNEPNVQDFIRSLSDFRDAIATTKTKVEMGELNTTLRKRARVVLNQRKTRAEKLLGVGGLG